MSHPLYPANQMPPSGEAPWAGEGPSAGELLPGGEPLSAGPAPDGRGGVESRVPQTSWPPWMAPVALVAAIVFAAVGGLVIDIPASLLGRKFAARTRPPAPGSPEPPGSDHHAWSRPSPPGPPAARPVPARPFRPPPPPP